MAADVRIDIAAQFVGKPAFRQAESATSKLEKGVRKLGRSIGLTFGTAAVLAYGKASVKAAAADQKAQQQLALALKNVGLGRDAASSESYIQRLQSEFGVVDDKLRPAYQTLAVATRDSAESQKLLNLSLDISASTGKDLETVTAALSKAYLGSNTALSKLGVGISKADLKVKSFDDIVSQLSSTFAGSATAAANTYQGSLDKLGVASNNVKETIGIGIIDALKMLGRDQNIDTATAKMEAFGKATNETLVGMSSLLSKLQGTKLGGAILGTLGDVLGNLQPFASFRKEGAKVNAAKNSAGGNAQALAHLAELESNYKIKTLKTTEKITKLTAQQLKDAKAKAILDKANAALGKGEDVFNLDKIQIAAALTNQAEQLGKATTGAQILQIANDTARLKVKQDILALEDAIASGDQKSIEAATAKLNEDMKILGALQGQSIKLLDIKSILDSLKPKDLINLDNLNEALRLLGLINLANTGSKTASTATTTAPSVAGMTPATTTAGINANVASLGGVVSVIADNGTEFIKLVDGLAPVFQAIEDVGTFNALVNSFASGTIGSFGAGSVKGNEGSLFNSGAVGSRDININVTTGIGDPNAIAEAVTQVIQDAVDRGTLRGGAY
jgi:hypothetical protein